jgi:hypothetical protein
MVRADLGPQSSFKEGAHMTTVYVVSNDEQVVKESILDTVGVAVESLGDAQHLRDQNPGLKIFAVKISEES